MNSNVVDFSSKVVSDEINQYWERFMQFVMERHPHLFPRQESQSDMAKVKQLMTILYRSLEKSGSGETIMEQFVNDVVRSVRRPATKSALEGWKDTQVSIFQFEQDQSDDTAVVRDVFTDELYEISKFTLPKDLDSSVFLFGFMMNWGHHFQIMPLAIPGTDHDKGKLLNEVRKRYDSSSNLQSEKELFQDMFLELFDLWFEEGKPDPLFILDGHPKAQAVLLKMRELCYPATTSDESYEDLEFIWVRFYQDTNPRVNKVEVMAATLEYLYWTSTFFGFIDPGVTQKEMAEKYGVSPNSVSRRIEEMEDYLFDLVEDMSQEDSNLGNQAPQIVQSTAPGWDVTTERAMYEMNKKLESQSFDNHEDINAYMNQTMNESYTPKNDEERAQLLAYDAYDEENPAKALDLIKRARELDPENIDGLILYSMTLDGDEKVKVLEQAIELGHHKLDLDEVKQDDNPWAIIEARCWFRANFALAEYYEEMANTDQAIEYYEKLLEWNPNDNQGVRYRLFSCYMEEDQLEDAEALLEMYPEESAHWLFNQALVAIEQANGQVNSTIEATIRKADSANPYVIPMLTGELPMPDQFPQSYAEGSVEEAIFYCDEYDYLWVDYVDVLNQLKFSRS